MNHKKYLEFIASFMVVLVLTLPFYTTSVYAGINSISAKGSNGIDGFVKSPDYLDVTVKVTSDYGSEIVPSQLRLGPQTYFSECTALTNVYECKVKWPSANPFPFGSGIQLYEVTFTENDDSTTLEQYVIVDDIAPQIISATTPKNLYSRDEEIIIDYDITDYSCNDAACSDKCSGIKKIEFLGNDVTSVLKTVVQTTTNCNVKGRETVVASASLIDGENSIYVRATDNLDQASADKNVNFRIDLSVPSINTNTFVMSRKNVIISSYSSNAITVDANITVTETSFSLDSVWGNFTNLSKTNAPGNIQKAVCTQIGSTSNYRCSWQGLQFNPDSNNIKVIMNASDTAGNRVFNVPITRALTLDNNGPVVNSLDTDSESGNQVYGKPAGNKVTAVFNEATGINADEALLYVGTGSSAATLRPDNCTKQSTSIWKCEWGNVDFGIVSTTMSIRTDTTDALLNPVDQNTDVSVIVDTQVAVLVGDVYVKSINAQEISDVFKIGDYIYAEANVTDSNPVTAKADFSDFILGADNVGGDCNTVDNKYKCTWGGTNSLGPITTSTNGQIRLTFTDAGGNQLPVSVPLQTLGLDGRPAPDFWKHTVRCYPQSIDRSTGTLTSQRVYCHVSLAKKDQQQQVSTVFISQPNCVTDYVSLIVENGAEILNNEVNSTAPIIKITLERDNFRQDDLNLSCELQIFSRINDVITSNPEIENVENISIKFYNLPLGELGDNIQAKINKAKRHALDNWKYIGSLNTFFRTAQRICRVINILYTVAAIFNGIAIAMSALQLACRLSIIGNAVGACDAIKTHKITICTESEGTSTTADESRNNYQKFCDYVTCREVWGKYGNDVKDWINNFPLAGNIGQTTEQRERARQQRQITPTRNFLTNRVQNARQISDYINPTENLIAGLLFACVPGIIAGLDKARQVECLYADCLENGVGGDGLPVSFCTNQQQYATCKYIVGEVFAVVPWIAVYDHFIGIIKDALSDPFTLAGMALSAACGPVCKQSEDGGIGYYTCRGKRTLQTLSKIANFLSEFGEIVGTVQDIMDNGFTPKDYCSRLSPIGESLGDEEEEATDEDT